MSTSCVLKFWVVFLVLASWSIRAQERDPARATADLLLTQEGVRQGIVLHIGDGALTPALLSHGVQVVRALVPEDALLSEARESIRGKGLYGPASVSVWRSSRLPFADDLVNVIVIDDASLLQQRDGAVAECLRVLAPYGTAFLAGAGADKVARAFRMAGLETHPVEGSDGAWLMGRKPFPAQMDEWPHYFHDSGHSNVSTDYVVGRATGLRWI